MMTHEEIVARRAEIALELDKPEADVDALSEEIRQLEQNDEECKRAAAVEAEKRAAVADGDIGETVKPVIEMRKENKPMTEIEIRSSVDYGKAFLNGIKTNDYTEARALLSTNAVSGNVPVPTFLEAEIKNAWENCEIANLCKKSYLKGNVKVGFELSATGAVIHTEGADAPDEEVLTIGAVELNPESIKKWITVSDEAIEATTVDTIGYLYAEIAQKIVECAEATLIGKITSSPATSNATACAVPVYSAAPAEDTIVMAEALLSGKARNLHIAMNRQTYAAFVAVGLKAKYNVDVWDGLRDRVVFTDALPAYSAASAGNVYAIVGDFSYGAQLNFPAGNDMSIKLDDLSLAEKDLVKVVGRQFVGMGVVAPKAFVNIKKA